MSRQPSDRLNISLNIDALARLMPMHAVIDGQGRVLSKGRTLAKLIGEEPFLFRALSHASIGGGDGGQVGLASERMLSGEPFSVRLRNCKAVVLRSVLVSLNEGRALMNFGFGVSLADAVRHFGLTSNDFSPTDLAMEFLFLHEANRAAMGLLGNVNESLERAVTDAQLQSLTDPLTGLLNRRAFDIEFQKAFNERGMRRFALLHLDLDDFKGINDRFGHAFGDKILVQVAQTILAGVRAQDMAFRIGGDEFLALVFLPESTFDIQAICRRLVLQIGKASRATPSPALSASIGVAMSHGGALDCEQMFRQADMALYAAKTAGKGRAVLSSSAGTGSAGPDESDGECG